MNHRVFIFVGTILACLALGSACHYTDEVEAVLEPLNGKCANPWFTGPNCDVCTDENYSGAECNVCSKRYSSSDDDRMEESTLEDADGVKLTRPICDICAPAYSGENCEECSNRFIGEKCDACSENFEGEACDKMTFAYQRTLDIEWVESSPAGVFFTQSEVTRKIFDLCIESEACDLNMVDKSSLCTYDNNSFGDKHPINCITVKQAEKLCRFMNGRLPTYQEWEDEVSEKGRRRYPWGDEDDSNCSHTISRRTSSRSTAGCGERKVGEVCQKVKGLSVSLVCDMVGNVAEYLSANRDGDYYFTGLSWNDQVSRGFFEPRSIEDDSFTSSEVGVRCVTDSNPNKL